MKHRYFYILLVLIAGLGAGLFWSWPKSEEESQPTAAGAQIAVTHASDAAHAIRYLSPQYEVKVHRDIEYAMKANETAALESLKLDVYEPANDESKERSVFLFIHGGGYREGTKADAAEFSTALAKRGYVVLSMDYRLKKEPEANMALTLQHDYEDIADVVQWVADNAAGYGMDPSKIAIGGDSAGGHLALNYVNAYLTLDPAHASSIYAIVDIYGGELDKSVAAKLPPVLIVHGTIDQLIPYQLSVNLKEQLQQSGIYQDLFTMEGVGHDYKNAKYLDEIVETTAHFLWNVSRHPDPKRLPEKSGIEAISGDAFALKLPKAYEQGAADGKLKAVLPQGWSVEPVSGNPSLVNVQLPAGLDRGNHTISFSLEQGEGDTTSFAMNVKVGDPILPSFQSYYDSNDQKLKTRLLVTNRSIKPISGELQVDYVKANHSAGTFKAAIEPIEPGKDATVLIPDVTNDKRTVQIRNAAGELIQQTEEVFHTVLMRKPKQPIQVDGHLTEWTEGATEADQGRFDIADVKLPDWKGETDLSAVGYSSWDQDNLYLAVQVTDDRHSQTEAGFGIWSGDSVQLAIGIADADGGAPDAYHEFGVAMNDQGQASKWRWLAPNGFNGEDRMELNEAISREGQSTVYELAIPWKELLTDTSLVKPGMKLKLSMLVNDNDGTGRRGWLEYNSGIGTAKDINAFGDAFLQ
ncbi:Carboxylesterase type B [Paenibacillus curdlanolyticus YK9]|uniref:Carboxylesterase type B n=1 Tax=Paenibacillus curdlanolyticus YK9 TaxID=717606 RepID=E0I4N3_9BACL|nr:alpha/beta hydrolase fold domain-containing protein [Paenibacillus curdlanolyticus]EFM12564.1 Carboxylesterase type B [Paenibacillus curdlanolyticus YK9]